MVDSVDRDLDAAMVRVYDEVAVFSENAPSKDDRTLVLVEVS